MGLEEKHNSPKSLPEAAKVCKELVKKSMSVAMQMRVCFTSMRRALQLRGNLLSIKTY